MFDPHADCSTLGMDPLILQPLQDGRALERTADTMERLRWTVSCAQCGQTYKRSNDLSAHILQCHAELWHQAQPMITMLKEASLRIEKCICNPVVPYPRASRICMIVVQMAMQHVRSRAPMLAPFWYSEDDFCNKLATGWAPELVPQIIESFISRQFVYVWTDAALLNALSSTCCFCGKATRSPGELLTHMVQQHQVENPGCAHFVPQLIGCMQQEMTTDYQCYACDTIFNLPTHEETDALRQSLVQNHLQYQCPVLQQPSYLFAGHGRFGSLRPIDGKCRDEGGVQQSGSLLHERKARDRRGTAQQTTQSRKRQAETSPEEPIAPLCAKCAKRWQPSFYAKRWS